MNRLEALLQAPGAAALGRTLLHSLWEGAVAALALAVVLCIVRSPRIRYASACIAMLILLSGLAITLVRLMPDAPAPMPLTGPHFAIPAPRDFDLPPIPNERNTDNLAWLVPFWIAGVVVFHLRGLTSWMAARRLRTTGVCCAAEVWQARLERLKERIGVSRPVALLESCLAEVPVVIGYVRPIILMPVGLLAGLPVGQVEAILLHELAHIRRYDYLVNLLQVLVEGLLFYHPAVWWISGVMRAERENCCDDRVVELTGGALEYASALTALEASRSSNEVLAATGGSLVNRVQRLLGRPERRYAAAMPVLTAAILTIVMATAMAGLQTKPAAPAVEAVAAQPVLLAQAQASPVAPQPAIRQTGQAITPPDKALYDSAVQSMQQGNYAAARDGFNKLINTYPASEYVIKAKLAIGDSWSREGDAHGKAQAEAEYKDFIEFYPNTPEAIKAKEAKLRLELETPYKKWMDQDVVYIISDEERKAFRQLDTDPEREHFVEQFWLRRDPTPGTTANEFKEEIYRRIDFADEHFGAAGLAGWKSDRGRLYIQYGPPDEIEVHPATADQPANIQWRYRYIDGIGQNIVIEFIDPQNNGEFRMTMDPNGNAFHLPPQR